MSWHATVNFLLLFYSFVSLPVRLVTESSFKDLNETRKSLVTEGSFKDLNETRKLI